MIHAKPSGIEPLSVPFARVDCSGNELSYVAEVLQSGWLTTASKAKRLEEVFADMIGCTHAIAVNSCTSALHLALDACGVGPGDKVLLPSLTFTATAEVVRYMGATPVLLDVVSGTACVEADAVDAALESDDAIVAVIAVHYGGHPIEMTNESGRGLADICRRRGVRLINDAAHALPSRRDGRCVGADGDVTCFSFYANKTMTTGEGGMLVTSDDDIAKRARLMRLHGIDRDVWDRFTGSPGRWEYDVTAPGFKYNMPDLNAAVGLAQFERLELMRQRRQECASRYRRELESVRCMDLPRTEVADEDHSWHLFPIVLRENAPISRNVLIEKLGELGIGTSVHYKPIHRLRYYRETYALDADDYPVTERIWNGCVSLPIYSLLTNVEIDYVIENVRRLLD